MLKVQCWLPANDSTCWHGSNYFHFSFFILHSMRSILHSTTQIMYGSDHVWVRAAQLGIQDAVSNAELNGYPKYANMSKIKTLKAMQPRLSKLTCQIMIWAAWTRQGTGDLDWWSELSMFARNSPLLHKQRRTGSQILVADCLHLDIVAFLLGFVWTYQMSDIKNSNCFELTGIWELVLL